MFQVLSWFSVSVKNWDLSKFSCFCFLILENNIVKYIKDSNIRNRNYIVFNHLGKLYSIGPI